MVASHAGDAVPRQAAEMRFRRVGGVRDGVDHCAQEVGAGLTGFGRVDRELTLALDAVAAEAGGLDFLGKLGVEEPGLAVQLGEEDRIATGEAHRARTLGAVGGEIVHN